MPAGRNQIHGTMDVPEDKAVHGIVFLKLACKAVERTILVKNVRVQAVGVTAGGGP